MPPSTAARGAVKLRVMIRNSIRGDAGYAVGYGLKFGYWPCLRAPFVQVSFNRWVFEIWYGLPSYKHHASFPELGAGCEHRRSAP
jgi:hypothetical protein